MNSFSKGDWKLARVKEGWIVYLEREETPTLKENPDICHVYKIDPGDDRHGPETEGNARLIAAAPKLLQACKDVFLDIDPETPAGCSGYKLRKRLSKLILEADPSAQGG